MLTRWLLAALHLIALAISVSAIIGRARAFGSRLDADGRARLFAADNAWGLSAVLAVTTGFWRVLAGTEKPSAYYWASNAFWLKMALLGVILLLEIWPMVTLIRWRVHFARGDQPDLRHALLFARISWLQLVLVVGLVLAATAMARGLGF